MNKVNKITLDRILHPCECKYYKGAGHMYITEVCKKCKREKRQQNVHIKIDSSSNYFEIDQNTMENIKRLKKK